MVENTSLVVNILFFSAAGLLLALSAGVLYLTTVEWRDRRRQSRDRKSR